jgi:hypothetical protein
LRWPQEDDVPARRTKGAAAPDGSTGRRKDRPAASRSDARVASEAALGAARVTRGEDEASSAATFSALSEAAARRGARDAAEGAATLSMADEVAVGGELAAALSTDEFRRGMELAGIAGQIQVAADLVRGMGQPTLAAFLARTSHQLRTLAVDAIGRASEGAIVAHGAAHLAGDLAALGRTEMGEGREEYATSEALGAASAEMAAAAVRSAAAGAADLAAAAAMESMAHPLATDGHDRASDARRTPAAKTPPAATPRAPKTSTRASSKQAPRRPAKPKK